MQVMSQQDTWTCDACTFINKCSSLSCSICGRAPISRVNAYIEPLWQWKINTEQYLNFDLQTSRSIETSYHQQPTVKSCRVYIKPYYYTIHFNGICSLGHYQINDSTGNSREIRRIAANDNNDILSKVDASALNDEQCSICQEEINNSSSSNAVQLSVCSTGHYFHDSCVLQWLSAYSYCPLCKRPLP